MTTIFQPNLEIDPKGEELELLGLGIDEYNLEITGETRSKLVLSSL